jgi:hypothetical protein
MATTWIRGRPSVLGAAIATRRPAARLMRPEWARSSSRSRTPRRGREDGAKRRRPRSPIHGRIVDAQWPTPAYLGADVGSRNCDQAHDPPVAGSKIRLRDVTLEDADLLDAWAADPVGAW